MKKVLVTGGFGYIGKHIVKLLAEEGFDVLVVPGSENNVKMTNKNISIAKEKIFCEKKDIFDRLGSPDVVIHLAWRDGFNHNSDSHINNLPLHNTFIKNMIDGGLKHLVTLGSIHEVGYFNGAVDESVAANPQSPYGVAKNSMRQLAEIYASQNGCIYQHIRAFYITGDDSSSNSVFGKILKAANDGQKKFPFVSGDKKYDFINIDELSRQIIAVSSQDAINGIINCCSGIPVSIGEKAEEFIRDNNLNISLEYGAFADRPYESPVIYGNNTKIKKIMANI